MWLADVDRSWTDEMSGGGRSTEPRIAAVAVAGCEGAAGSSRSGGDVEGPGSHGAILDQSPSGGGLTCRPGLARRIGKTGRTGESGLWGPLHVCDWSYRSLRARPEDVVRLNCTKPTVLGCDLCEALLPVRCKATRDDKCAPCAERHRWDIARTMRSGFTEERLQAALIVVLAGTREERREWLKHGVYGRHTKDNRSGFFLVTITAPGAADGLRFDRSICGHEPGQCSNKGHASGETVCKVERMPAALWNGEAPRRFNDWMTDLRRVLDVDVQYSGAWETQVRGMLHRHVLVYCAGVTVQRFYDEAKRIAQRVGFGRQFEADPISGMDAREVAMTCGYVASYVTKCGDELATCISPRTGEILQGSYRRWSCSRRWGVTMKQVRQERVQWATERYGADRGGGGARDEHAAPGGAAALDSEQESYASPQQPEPVLGVSLA